MTAPVCPRCEGFIPNNATPGAYPGAISRFADVEICSACGTDEALRGYYAHEAIPRHEWPAAEAHTYVPEPK